MPDEVFEKMYKISPIGIAFMDLHGNFTKGNASFCDLVSYSESELVKKNAKDITHPEDLQAYLDLKSRLIDGEIDFCTLYKRYISKIGRSVWVRLTLYPIKDETRHIKFFTVHAQQIINGEKFKLEYRNAQELCLREESISFAKILVQNWQWFAGAGVFLVTMIIAFGITVYSLEREVEVLKAILLDKVKIETKQQDDKTLPGTNGGS